MPVVDRCECPGWHWISGSGIPSRNSSTAVEFARTFRDLDDAVDAQMPVGRVVDISRQVGLGEVRQALGEFFDPRARPIGSVLMNMIFRCVLVRPRF